MSAILIDGKACAAELLTNVRARVSGLPTTPCLATVLVGDDPASHTYVRMKRKRAADTGIDSRGIELPATTTTATLVDVIDDLGADNSVHGILLQHPVPSHIDERAAFDAIPPSKDVDGVTSTSLAATALGQTGFRSCTPEGIMRLLRAYSVPIRGRSALVIGRSPILGLPMGLQLLDADATVVYAHSHTRDLAARVAEADIVVAAAGRAGLIDGQWIKPGAAVIDAGYSTGPSGRSAGDVVAQGALDRAGWITPVPGGVGPMTIATLLDQTVAAAELSAHSAI